MSVVSWPNQHIRIYIHLHKHDRWAFPNRQPCRKCCETNKSPSSSQTSDSATALILCNYLTSQNRSKSCCPGATAMHHSTLTCSLQCCGRVNTQGTLEVVLEKRKQACTASDSSYRCGKDKQTNLDGMEALQLFSFLFARCYMSNLMQSHLKMHPFLSTFASHPHCTGNFLIQNSYFPE